MRRRSTTFARIWIRTVGILALWLLSPRGSVAWAQSPSAPASSPPSSPSVEDQAEPPPSTESSTARFSDAYRRGVELFRQNEFSGAIIEFTAAYGLKAEPRLLFNIAQCHRKQDRLDEGIEFFDRYLRADINVSPSVRAEIQAYQAELRAKKQALAAQRKEKTIVIATEKPAPRWYIPGGIVAGILGLGGVVVGGSFIGINGRCVDMPQAPALECTRLYNSLTPGIAITAVGGSLAVIGTVFLSLSIRRPQTLQKPDAEPTANSSSVIP